MYKLTILGSGTSTGVPEIGCECDVCRSNDRKDKRCRCSALLQTEDGKNILIDCGPDFRQQALDHHINHLDAILITHEHYDHISGIDDLRTIAWLSEIPIYAEPRVISTLQEKLFYFFDAASTYPGKPRLKLVPIEPGVPFYVGENRITPIRILHGKLPILGYRFDQFAYLTDMSAYAPEFNLDSYLQDLDFVVINGLRMRKPHPSHQQILDVLSHRHRWRNPPCMLTHLSHHAPLHAEMEHFLPPGVYPTYDDEIITKQSISARIKENTRLDFTSNPTPSIRKAFPLGFVSDCGNMPYTTALSLQRRLFNEAIAQKKLDIIPANYLLLCEHQPVLTLGLHGKENNLLITSDLLKSKGIELHHIERGGDITYHGPGQITGYPILDLEQYGIGLREYIDLLEEMAIRVSAHYGIKGCRIKGASGVWIEADEKGPTRKICAIGVKSSRFVTMHGFALNVNTDLNYFKLINPCGFTDKGATSIAKEIGKEVEMNEVKTLVASILSELLTQHTAPPTPASHNKAANHTTRLK